jgi:hypothetical protein
VVDPFAVWPFEATFGDAFIERLTLAQQGNELLRAFRQSARAFLLKQIGQRERARYLLLLKSDDIASMIIGRPTIFDKGIIRVTAIRNQMA